MSRVGAALFLALAALVVARWTAVCKANGQPPSLSPLSGTAFQQPSSVFVFTCTGGPGDVLWRVNGHSQSDAQVEQMGIYSVTEKVEGSDGFTSRLMVPQTLENNGTEVVCLLIVGSTDVSESETGTLLIQGLLAAPPNLTLVDDETNTHNIKLVWSAPFTLDVTSVDPDIFTYTICNNITGYCSNTSGPGVQEYVFPRLCGYAEFTVAAVNGAGVGEEGRVVSGLEGAEPVKMNGLTFVNGKRCYEVEILSTDLNPVNNTSDDRRLDIEAGVYSIALVLGLLVLMCMLGAVATTVRFKHKEALHEALPEDNVSLTGGHPVIGFKSNKKPRSYLKPLSATIQATDKEAEAKLDSGDHTITGKSTAI